MSIPTTSCTSEITMLNYYREDRICIWSITNFASISDSDSEEQSIFHKAVGGYPMTTSKVHAHFVTGSTMQRKSIWTFYLYVDYVKQIDNGKRKAPFLSLHVDYSKVNKNVLRVLGNFSIVTSDGRKVNTKAFRFTYGEIWKLTELEFFIVREDLLRDKVNLLKNGTLRIQCEMSLWYNFPSHTLGYIDRLDRNKLVCDLMNLLRSNKCCDVTLLCIDSEFKVHKAILSVRSPVFSAMFEHETMESKTNIVSIEDISGRTMKKLLAFMYGQDLGSTLSVESCADLYIAADRYKILELKRMCARFMSFKLSVENFSRVALLADLHQDSKLLEAAGLFVKRNTSQLSISKEWISLASKHYEVAKKLI